MPTHPSRLAPDPPAWSHPEALTPAGLDPGGQRAAAVLARRYGHRWTELPLAAGRPAARAEALLVQGPTALDPDAVEPDRAIEQAARVLAVARGTVALAHEGADVLGEALAVDLTGQPLGSLAEIAGAVLELSTSPRAASHWAWPRHADAAEVVVRETGKLVRTAAHLHCEMYQRYTDAVWEVPDGDLAPLRPWHLGTRWRLRRSLSAASRTGRVPGRLGPAARELARVRVARRELAPLAGLVATHLGELDRGPMTDLHAALEALAAVRRLQRALGDDLDPQRLSHLLVAGAFAAPEVCEPAIGLRQALTSWAREVEEVRGDPSPDLDLAGLAGWTAELDRLLPSLTAGAEVSAALGAPARTMTALVDHLLAREHVQDAAPSERPGPAPAPSIRPAPATRSSS